MQHVGSALRQPSRRVEVSLAREHLAQWHHLGPVTRLSLSYRRAYVTIGRPSSVQRLSQIWTPTTSLDAPLEGKEEAHSLLLRAGYLRQAQAGIFHSLPLGQRLQQKLEAVIDKHMQGLGAAKVSLSSISSEDLWRQSGRITDHTKELFRFKDRKDGALLLAPTHEEEITSLVAASVQSYRDLPLRLYQITRKYRDEARPRQGLLRGREFTMKDLYTFDSTVEKARGTYEKVRAAYSNLFTELKLPFLVAEADSGSMGGNLSHEYHIPSTKGEDTVVSCDTCDYVSNEEAAYRKHNRLVERSPASRQAVESWYGVSRDRRTLVQAVFPQYTLIDGSPVERRHVKNSINPYAVKAALPDIDLDTGVEDAYAAWIKHDSPVQICLIDPRLPDGRYLHQRHPFALTQNQRARIGKEDIAITRTVPGDVCARCHKGRAVTQRAIEIGHTFHLGTRYSEPLDAKVMDHEDKKIPVQMGCHGIGVSRLMATIAALYSDDKGLNWPAAIAPYNVVIIPITSTAADSEALYRQLIETGAGIVDPILDDRDKEAPWKLKDADLIGYPIVLVFGRAWKKSREVELQCRRLKIKKTVHIDDVPQIVAAALQHL